MKSKYYEWYIKKKNCFFFYLLIIKSEPVTIKDDEKGKEICKFSAPHSNAFIDLDGDCLSGK